ncbi:MAG: hypothetical protein JGK17_32465 [Microcoleus sp. PH2017_10_PVI_O_A]|uniref:hypothetical protein n=1 Tax=unclassified Microcoleus TaxID=2642155 RepID=UPI001D42668E|nr:MULTISPECIES: hypothetical protein [unclassified Microcoleus]MCC3410163.1 hypothetical protein [Microcoleus sp. PH2017_10_PVI_O_A]MCC3464430.1 hypothetical protein [Microcoleus sp. PH2017_11_PCY_U_A]MCC3482360.1 hypothetical protein [Microcoleus sp. PH2017_12_PCY_D_A]MCC3563735.1 hypothetical protein [Microcoleus sp. PH2017_27_LUM_O_A]TAE75740.1 MAG: hypothetical protein EAZ83_29050 [Oscillatoriales cyanobacterium]
MEWLRTGWVAVAGLIAHPAVELGVVAFSQARHGHLSVQQSLHLANLLNPISRDEKPDWRKHLLQIQVALSPVKPLFR